VERQDSRRAGNGTGDDRRPTLEPRAQWEETLDRLERELGSLKVIEIDTSWELQLVLARQLRELILALRPLMNHPLLRRS
jgi:hypothetical protein